MQPLSAPYYAEAALTARCNLHCGYCYFRNSACETPEELTTGEWLDVFAEFGQMKMFKVILSGGEVLLREDLPQLIEGVCRNNMRFSLLSNGYFFEDRHAVMLKESGRCNSVQISVDGVEEVHDSIRGRGSFARAVRAIGILREHGLRTQVRITIGKHNLGTLMETVRYLLEEAGVPVVAANWAQHFSCKEGDGDSGHLLSMREQLQSMVEVKRVHAAFPERFLVKKAAFTNVANRWKDILDRRELTGASLLRCPAQLERISIRADGAITPCNHISHMVLGWAGKDRIIDVWRNSPVLLEMREHDCDPAEEFPACAACGYNRYCRPAGACFDQSERATPYCLKKYQEAAPDFDFERLEWK